MRARGWSRGRVLHEIRARHTRCDVSSPFAIRRKVRDQLAIKLLPLVRRLALQMRERLPTHVELEDLVSAGVIGLLDAIGKFDGRKNVKLESYAQHRIRGAILDGLRRLDNASRDMRKKTKKAERLYHDLQTRLGRPPSDGEIAEALGVSLKKWYRMVQELQAVGFEWLRPMGSVAMKESVESREETLAADDHENQFELTYRREQKEILNRALARLSEREQKIVSLYYQQEFTMKEIGNHLGIDESRVSQLHSSALLRLRARAREILSWPRPSVTRLMA